MDRLAKLVAVRVLVLALGLPVNEARAVPTVLTVDEGDDLLSDGTCGTGWCTLRDAISDFNVGSGDYEIDLPTTIVNQIAKVSATAEDANVAGDIDITRGSSTLTISGVGATVGGAAVVGLAGTVYPERVFHVTGDTTLVFANVEISAGEETGPGGAIYSESGDVEAYDCSLLDNMASNGAGIFAGTGAIYVYGTQVKDNVGGGIYASSGTVTVSNSQVVHNTVRGGVRAPIVDIADSTVSYNDVAFSDGGGVAADTLYASNTTFENNTTNQDGGGALVGTYAEITNNTQFNDNKAWGCGGGILISTGDAELADVTLTHNLSTMSFGGGLCVDGLLASASLDRVHFDDNEAVIFGGAIFVDHGALLSASNSTFDGNKAYEGGALYVYEGTADLSECILEGNRAGNRGGAIYSGGLSTVVATVNLTDTYLAGNTAVLGEGGAIFAKNGPVAASSSTFDGNVAAGGGAIWAYKSSVATTSTLVSVHDCAFVSNIATSGNGGAIGVYGGRTVVSASDAANNSATLGGGGVLAINGTGTVALSDSTMSENSAGLGGAVYIYGIVSGYPASLDALRVNVVSNVGDFGGAVHAEQLAELHLDDCLVASNRATSDGGGLYLQEGPPTAEVTRTEFEANVAGDGGAAFINSGNQLTVTRSSFLQNYAELDPVSFHGGHGGAVALVGDSLLEVDDATFWANVATTAGGAVWFDPEDQGNPNASVEFSALRENMPSAFYHTAAATLVLGSNLLWDDCQPGSPNATSTGWNLMVGCSVAFGPTHANYCGLSSHRDEFGNVRLPLTASPPSPPAPAPPDYYFGSPTRYFHWDPSFAPSGACPGIPEDSGDPGRWRPLDQPGNGRGANPDRGPYEGSP